MKATKPKIVGLVLGILVIGTAALYLASFLADYSARGSLENALDAGMEMFEKGQYREAAAKLQECYQKAPDGKLKNQALLFLARSSSHADERDEALQLWGKVAENRELEAHYGEAYYSLAELRSMGGKPEDQQAAEAYLKKAAATGPRSRFADLAQIQIARNMMNRGHLQGAQQILQELQKGKDDHPQLKEATYELNMRLLFSPIATEVPKSEYYVVKQGDTLDGIAKKFDTTAELLEESNRVTPRRLQIGKRLKVITGNFLLKISKSKNTLQLVSENTVLNEYPIGTGKFGKTPVGRFKIADKVKEPPWFKDGRVIPYGDPQNVLGTRWMKLESINGKTELTGYGIHGTDDESSIGKQSSEGCIRLTNRRVEELYKIVTVGTEVVIEE